MRLRPACLLLVLALAGRLTAAGPLAVPPPKQGAAPLLHVLFSGPPGVRVTFYQGQAPPRELPTPVVVGLRPVTSIASRWRASPNDPASNCSRPSRCAAPSASAPIRPARAIP